MQRETISASMTVRFRTTATAALAAVLAARGGPRARRLRRRPGALAPHRRQLRSPTPTGRGSPPTRTSRGCSSSASSRAFGEPPRGSIETAGVADRDPRERRHGLGGLQPHRRSDLESPRTGGRVLLPLECYTPGGRATPAAHGAIGVADPGTARLPLLRQPRPGRDPQGDVGRDLARTATRIWHEQRRRPARLPLQRRRPPLDQGPSGPAIHAVRRLRRRGAAHRRSPGRCFGERPAAASPARPAASIRCGACNTDTGAAPAERETRTAASPRP